MFELYVGRSPQTTQKISMPVKFPALAAVVVIAAVGAACVAPRRLSAQAPAVRQKIRPDVVERVPLETLQRHGLTAGALKTLPPLVLLTIEAVDPAETWEKQPFIARYVITNLTYALAKGSVTATLDGASLVTPPAPPLNLAPGESTTGQILGTAGPAGLEHLHVLYQDGVHCHDSPLWTGGSRQVCLADVSADDTVELHIRRIGDILTSVDLPQGQAAAGAEVCGNGTETYPNVGVPFEWADTPNGGDVPAVGYAITPKPPGSDVPWSHPFGADYSFGVVLDRAYWSILNPRGVESTADCSAAGLQAGRGDGDICVGFPIAHTRHYSEFAEGIAPDVGIIHAEIEDGLVPSFFKPLDGDRVYLRGRRIIDCGHNNFSTEIHPPTLIATARRLDTGRVVSSLIGVPYRTLGTYGQSSRRFHEELAAEIAAVSQTPVPLNLIANITSEPFGHDITARYRIAVPPIAGKGRPRLGYHFSTRPGVRATVTRTSDFEAEVEVSIDSAMYAAPQPPVCGSHEITLADAERLNGMPKGSLSGLFSKYIQPASYTSPLWAPLLVIVPILGPFLAAEVPHWLIDATISAQLGLSVGQCTVPSSEAGVQPGTLLDNKVIASTYQPYPILGWMVFDWLKPVREVPPTIPH
jgi:hypothetical protein